MNYPFGSITITPRAKELVNIVLNSGKVSQGRFVREFEEKFADLLGVKEAVAVSSGTDADVLALASLYDVGARRGDEVIIPALSFVATGNAVVHAGFEPVFVDVKRDTLNINPDKIESKITKKTRAIMPVHLMGKPADMDYIMDIAKKNNLYVIEDAAEAHGAKYKGKNVGTIGNLGAFSLYVAHIISSVEGGIITTGDSNVAEAVRSLRSHGRMCSCKSCVINTDEKKCSKRFEKDGRDRRFLFNRIGYSSKMNELEAAVGLGSLEIYSKILEKRRNNLKYLMKEFGKFSPYLNTFSEESYEIIGPHAFPILLGDVEFTREDYSRFLNKKGIDTRDLFASIPTQYPSFKQLKHKLGDFPEAEYIGINGVHIGVHQDIEDKHLDYFLSTTEEFLKNKGIF